MSVNTFSAKADGGRRVAVHFRVGEFACRDGSDPVLLDDRLPPVLEDIRARCGARPIAVNSGYRSPAYNQKVGGAAESYHMRGMAADIAVAGVTPNTVAAAAELALYAAGLDGGIGLYGSFVHVDVRESPWRQNMVSGARVSGFGPAAYPTLKRGAENPDEVRRLQETLNRHGAGIKADGVFGVKTERAVKDFQALNGMIVDGVAGRETWLSMATVT
ncbi:MAG: peptidoglycan-binding protein [Oscillospiraceae bacterium]|jgi:hypothetical protein|nr:peptidoglycan-binding protein [Oscillospiraceae bacterium]